MLLLDGVCVVATLLSPHILFLPIGKGRHNLLFRAGHGGDGTDGRCLQ